MRIHRYLIAMSVCTALAVPASAQVDAGASRAWHPGKPARDALVTTFPGAPIDQSRVTSPTGDLRGSLAASRSHRPAPLSMRGPRDTSAELIEVNWAMLDRLDPGLSHRVGFPLPEGGLLELVLVTCEWRDVDRYTWIGQIAGVANSDVILVRHDDALRVIARNHNPYGRTLEVRRAASGHLLTEFSAVGVPSCDGCLTAAPVAETTPQVPDPTVESLGGASDPADVIDVMVVASDLARSYFGSEAGLAAEAYAMVIDANIRVSLSGGAWQFRLCAAPWDLIAGYTEAGDICVDLYELRLLQGVPYSSNTCSGTTSDSFTDAIQANRDAYRPDLVCMLTTTGGLGLAPRPGTTASFDVDIGYFISNVSVAVSNGTFAHEAGHTLGGCHNANASAPSCNQGINGTDRGIERLCDVDDGICGGCEDTEFRTTLAYAVTTNPLNGTVRVQRYSAFGVTASLVGTFSNCTVDLWDTDAQAMLTFEVGRPYVSNYNIGSTQVWAEAGAGVGNGTYIAPVGSISDAVGLVNGGAAEGVVRAVSGTYDDVGGSPVTYSSACTIVADGGEVTIQ